MKILLQTRYSSPNANAEPGCTIDVSEAEAKELIEGRYALSVAETAAEVPATPETESSETAEAPAAPETAARKPASRRVRG